MHFLSGVISSVSRGPARVMVVVVVYLTEGRKEMHWLDVMN